MLSILILRSYVSVLICDYWVYIIRMQLSGPEFLFVNQDIEKKNGFFGRLLHGIFWKKQITLGKKLNVFSKNILSNSKNVANAWISLFYVVYFLNLRLKNSFRPWSNIWLIRGHFWRYFEADYYYFQDRFRVYYMTEY